MRILGPAGAVLACVAMLAGAGPGRAGPPPAAQATGERLELAAADGGAVLRLGLSARVPFRVFALAEPMRIVLDFEGLDWAAALAAPAPAGPVAGLRWGLFRPGWSRLVLDLARPAAIVAAAYLPEAGPGAAFRLELRPAAEAEFLARAGAPEGALWTPDPAPGPALPGRRRAGEPLVVVVDPGHGGIDPGAVRDALTEKDIALAAARIIARRLDATGRFRAVLTRDADRFVPLRERVRIAQESRADALLSIHVNTEETGTAAGVSVFSLSAAASDRAAERLAAFENGADVLTGADLAGKGSEIARLLVDMAQRETNHRSRRLALAVLARLDRSASLIRSNPHRAAGFEVLKAPDVPSLLVELGFLSNDGDRARLTDPAWAEAFAADLVAALDAWAAAELAERGPHLP